MLEASRLSSEAARDSAEAARAANEQACVDSKVQTRPLVWVEILPGLAGSENYDVRIRNTGRSSARDVRLEFSAWPDAPDDVTAAIRTLFHTPRTLAPGAAVRSFWQLEGSFTDGTSVAGLPSSGSIYVTYRGDDPSEPRYHDTFEVMIERADLWPVGESGPTADGLTGDARKFYILGQAPVRRISELAR